MSFLSRTDDFCAGSNKRPDFLEFHSLKVFYIVTKQCCSYTSMHAYFSCRLGEKRNMFLFDIASTWTERDLRRGNSSLTLMEAFVILVTRLPVCICEKMDRASVPSSIRLRVRENSLYTREVSSKSYEDARLRSIQLYESPSIILCSVTTLKGTGCSLI